MGFIFQGYFLLPELTALENVLLPAMIGGTPPRPCRTCCGNSLREVGLGDRMHHLPLELSGGEQQRVAIARALINDPGVVFADEPTGNLDSKSGSAIMDLLLALVREKRKTLLVVTHDLSLAARGDRTLEMRDGQARMTNDGNDGKMQKCRRRRWRNETIPGFISPASAVLCSGLLIPNIRHSCILTFAPFP